MQLRFQKLKGMEVLAEKEGKLLGSVRRVQMDSARKVALGLVIKAKAISSEQSIRVAAVNRVGLDVVFVADTQAVTKEDLHGRDVKDILGLSVTSLDGKRLGTLTDIVIDCESWSITALVLDSGGEVEVGPKSVFGEDAVLVEKAAAQKLGQPTQQQPGFLSRVFNAEGAVLKSNPSTRTKKKIDSKKNSS